MLQSLQSRTTGMTHLPAFCLPRTGREHSAWPGRPTRDNRANFLDNTCSEALECRCTRADGLAT